MTETRLYEPARLSTPPEQTAGYLRSSKILIHVLATQTDITDDRQNLPLIAVERKYRIYPPPLSKELEYCVVGGGGSDSHSFELVSDTL